MKQWLNMQLTDFPSTGNNYINKPVGDWISAPSPHFVAMATRVGPQHFAWFHWIGHPRKPPRRPKHLRSICHTSRLIGDFVQILGSKFSGLNQKSKNVLYRGSWRTLNWRSKMARFHREIKKKQFEVFLWQTDRQTVNCWQMTIIDS